MRVVLFLFFFFLFFGCLLVPSLVISMISSGNLPAGKAGGREGRWRDGSSMEYIFIYIHVPRLSL